jgi:hypothetical protein
MDSEIKFLLKIRCYHNGTLMKVDIYLNNAARALSPESGVIFYLISGKKKITFNATTFKIIC